MASYTEQLADYLRKSDGNSLINDVERFARKQPVAVSLGGLALGFAASRVLRASSERRHDSDAQSSSSGRSSSDASYSPPTTPGTGSPTAAPSYTDLDGPPAGRPGTTPPLARPEDPLTAPVGGNSVDR